MVRIYGIDGLLDVLRYVYVYLSYWMWFLKFCFIMYYFCVIKSILNLLIWLLKVEVICGSKFEFFFLMLKIINNSFDWKGNIDKLLVFLVRKYKIKDIKNVGEIKDWI